MEENTVPFRVSNHLPSTLSMTKVKYYDFIYLKYTLKLLEKESNNVEV